jgi:hypothetical protein
MAFDNLPGIFGEKNDGNLAILPVNNNPKVCIIGTSAQGDSEEFYSVDKISDATAAFGKSGTLIRGMYEASIGGAENLRLMRIGATAAILTSIGESGGLTITTVAKDDTAGTSYSLFFDASLKRLRVWEVSSGTLVYDNNPSYPLDTTDTGAVAVSGSITGTPTTDIGTLAVPVTMAAADNGGDGPAVYTAGTDGVADAASGAGALSLMETYEALYRAYDLLKDQDIDVVLPMGVYVDDLNVMDMNTGTINTRGLTALSAYPNGGETNDVLGKLFVEEYEGEYYFWWWFPNDPSNPTFTAANIFPTAGSASATLKTDGVTALTAADFHEVNFGWQLAYFCYDQSQNNEEMTGVIGMLPSTGLSTKLVSQWVGTLPTTTTDVSGNTVITTNGTGLLGNKWLAGRVSANGIPGRIVGGVDGLYGGGFIATDDGWIDGSELEDDNDHLVDIGKYISVVATHPILANPSRSTSYTATGAAIYGGFYSGLPPASAPTNKRMKSVSLPYRIGKAKLDSLAGLRYVTFHAETNGIVVSDAPTAARTDSDYRRLSTMRIVKAVIDDVRIAGRPFIGEGITGNKIAALDTAVDKKLSARVKSGDLQRYEHRVIATPSQRVLGQASIELKLVPAFELRQVTVTVGLAAV